MPTKILYGLAPYIKNGRAFVPVRYAAKACGVSSDNIIYADGKVTLIKGDKVVQLTIGSNVMLINGITINMDVAPENVNGQPMLSFDWIAYALGISEASWDSERQQVVFSSSDGLVNNQPTNHESSNQDGNNTQIPEGPTRLSVESIVPDSVSNHYRITLSWDPVNSATAYRIYSTASWYQTAVLVLLKRKQTVIPAPLRAI
ncbi:MAG: copper amine oxidase N-terminal domain-containing protein [Bacillota bacterium]